MFVQVEIADRKGETSIPDGWGVDCNGKDTTNPKEVLGGKGGLHPLGGKELNSKSHSTVPSDMHI